jgi:predicted dehydrogenase
MIRVGLVGFGMAGRVFHAPLISSVEGLQLAAVLERHTDKASERYPGIVTYRSLEAMLADDSLDLFVVATPSGTHFEVATQLLAAGKNIIVDKPMSPTSAQIAELIKLAQTRKLLLIPFHNRRWDSDFQTIQKLLNEGSLGRLVHLESTFDRWRPHPPIERLWKEDPGLGGGVLLDLGTHVADQALTLFGKPNAIYADVLSEREWARANDAFMLRLRYTGFSVTLSANSLSSPARPRFHLRGTKGNYWKWGLDPQEAALNRITKITDSAWGQDPTANWGTLNVDVEGGMVTRPITPIPGDYRLYYAAVRDALLGKSLAPLTAIDAWRVARLLEWAEQSSKKRCEIPCEWSEEPG